MTDTTIPPHPAKWSQPILDKLAEVAKEEAELLGRPLRVVDPFAGSGLGRLAAALTPSEVWGVELEPEWAAAHPNTLVGDALELRRVFADRPPFDAVVTSPCYGSRMADAHDAKDGSTRLTYKHRLGRDPNPGSAAVLQWGPDYRRFHAHAYAVMCGFVPGGLLAVNMSNHIRHGEEQPVVEWTVRELLSLGCRLVAVHRVRTRRLRFGANREKRVDGEAVIVCRPPDGARLL